MAAFAIWVGTAASGYSGRPPDALGAGALAEELRSCGSLPRRRPSIVTQMTPAAGDPERDERAHLDRAGSGGGRDRGEQEPRCQPGSVDRPVRSRGECNDIQQVRPRSSPKYRCSSGDRERRRGLECGIWASAWSCSSVNCDQLSRSLTRSPTHIANRRTFDAPLRESMSPGQAWFVLAVLDIDGFKAINDEQGHAQGDRALVAVAQTLKASVRQWTSSPDLRRQFAVLISGALAASGGISTEDHHLDAVWNVPGLQTRRSRSRSARAEFSAGDTADSLIHRADEALYQAKHLARTAWWQGERPTRGPDPAGRHNRAHTQTTPS